MALPRGRVGADNLFSKTKALPAAASTAVYSDSMDLMNGPNGTLGQVDLVLTAPALTATELPNTRTLTFALQDSADDSSFADVAGYEQICYQVGAGSAVAAESPRITLPSTVRRYIRVRATTGASTGNCSGKSLVAALKF